MDTMPPPMAIPCIRVDGQHEQEAGHIEDLRWPSYSAQQQQQDHYGQQQYQQQQAQPQPPFKLDTNVQNFNTPFSHQQHFNTTIERFVEDQFAFHVVPQSAPVRDFSPFDNVAWIPEPASAITQYQERLSSPDETILSSTSGSNYWPSSTFSNRFDSVSYSPASQDPNISRRGSAFESMSAASELHDPFSWSRSDAVYGMQQQEPQQHHHGFSDVASFGGQSFTQPNMPASAQISRHATPFMFNNDMDIDCHTRASSIPPQPSTQHQHSMSVPMQQSHSHSSHISHVSNHFRYPSPHDALQLPIRQSLTPGNASEVEALSDFDIPLKSDNDCDSDYFPGRSARPRSHRVVRSATHIRRPSYNQHHRSSSYNAACAGSSPTANRIQKRTHTRRPSSSSNIPHIGYSPKTSNRHSHASSFHSHAASISSMHSGPVVHPPTQQVPRPFTCPLTPYSCPKTFTSKNEWKRHVLTQHLLLGFWRCDLCPDATSRPNDFNRKDLFVQHLRRMHCGDRRGAATVFDSPDGTEDHLQHGAYGMAETTEQALERVRKRCWIQLRRAPKRLECCFCAKSFESKEEKGEQERERGCAVDWLEHVGRHLVAMTGTSPSGTTTSSVPAKKEDDDAAKNGHRRRKSGSSSSKSSVDAAMVKTEEKDPLSFTEPPWDTDALLLSWLIEEGLVEESEFAAAEGLKRWVLVDRGVASEAAIARKAEGEGEGEVEA